MQIVTGTCLVPSPWTHLGATKCIGRNTHAVSPKLLLFGSKMSRSSEAKLNPDYIDIYILTIARSNHLPAASEDWYGRPKLGRKL